MTNIEQIVADERTLAAGPYIYKRTPQSPAIFVEVMGQHVAEVGEYGFRPLRYYPGEFVRLVPVTQQEYCHQ